MEYERIMVDAKEWNSLITFLKDLIRDENLRNSDILRLLNLPKEEIYLEYIFEDYQRRRINKIYTELSNVKRNYESQYSVISTHIKNIKSSPLLFKEFYINHRKSLLNKYKNIIDISLSKKNSKLIIHYASQLDTKSLGLHIKKLLSEDKFNKNKYQFKKIGLLRN